MNADSEDVSYLDIKPEDRVPIPSEQKVWAKIGDDLKLEYIDWGIINDLAKQFDEIHKANGQKTESHVICKLLTLVREEARKEYEK